MKKNKIMQMFLIVIALIAIDKVEAQKYPTPVSAEKGVVVFVGNSPDKSIHYLLEKKETSQDKFSTLAILTRPSTYVEFKGLLLYYSSLVASININDEKMVTSVWKDLEKGSSAKNTGYWNIPAVALAAGLAFYDTSMAVGKSYTYKVSVLKNGKIESTGISDPINQSDQRIKNPILFHDQSCDEHHAYLEWRIVGLPRPSNFEVFRSTVAKTEFTAVTTVKGFRSSGDTLIFIVKDTLVRPRETYSYYIQARDLFGNPFEESEQIRVTASSSASDPVVLKMKAISNEKRRAIQLDFKITAAPELRNIRIERSEEFNGNYELLTNIPPTDTVYFDKTAIPFKSYYYRLVIQTLNGKTVPSANVSGFLSVEQFLMPPSNLKATQTVKGVELHWENSEPNIVGFIVYRCEGYRGTLEQISSVISSNDLSKGSYVDTLVTPKTIYSYGVKSVDKLLTESSFADTVSIISLKNALPPATPTRLRATPSSTEIMLTWDNMYAGDPSLMGYNIYRKKAGEPDNSYSKLNPNLLGNLHNYYSDTLITPGFGYVYTIEGVDVYNLVSAHSYPVESRLISPMPVSPTGIRLFNQKDQVLITWDEPMNNEISEYRLYRIDGEEKPKQIGTYKPGTVSATDNSVKGEQYYVYYLTSVSIYGVESEAIDVVSIRR
jgi:fibronectin type 3 domain-containing protein